MCLVAASHRHHCGNCAVSEIKELRGVRNKRLPINMLPPTAELPPVLVKERGEETKTLCIRKIQNKKYRKIQKYNQQVQRTPTTQFGQKEKREMRHCA